MIYELYIIKNNMTQEISPALCCRNRNVAIRMFSASLRSPDLIPSEFDLFLVGSVDDDTLVITPEPVLHILNGSNDPFPLVQESK